MDTANRIWIDHNKIVRMNHNWIHDTNQRNPSTDNVAYAHLYNNHMQNISGYEFLQLHPRPGGERPRTAPRGRRPAGGIG